MKHDPLNDTLKRNYGIERKPPGIVWFRWKINTGRSTVSVDHWGLSEIFRIRVKG